MSIIRISIISAILLASILMVYRVTPGKSKLLVANTVSQFPVVSGFNLDRQEFEFPRDFEGKLNLVIVPFLREHQLIVDTWIPKAKDIETDFPGFIYYELPTLTNMSTLYRTFLNEGMRAGIPDQTARQRTVTLYLDKQLFRSALEIPSEKDIHLFLVDQSGNILWRETGAHSDEKAAGLLKVLQETVAYPNGDL